MAGKSPILAVKIIADSKQFTKGLDQADSAISKWGKRLAAGFAAIGAVNVFKGMISDASDLNESINAVNVTFGKAAEGVLKLGEEAATSVGLSKNEFNGLAVQFSNFASTVAGPGGDVVNTLDSITTRAADFASVMNLEVKDAAALFQSGLAGESEPLRKFGIDLSAAAVEAYAYANGIAESGAKLTESEKVQARYALLMEKTANTQGDFANTSDSLANAQRIISASWENISATLGNVFLPIIATVASFIADKVIPALQEFADFITSGDLEGLADALNVDESSLTWLTTLRDKIIEFGDFITGTAIPAVQDFGATLVEWQDVIIPIAAGIGAIVLAFKVWQTTIAVVTAVTKAWAAVQLVMNAVLAANPIGLIVLAIVGLVTALVVAYKKSETFREIVNGVFNAVKNTAESVFNAIKAVWSVMFEVLSVPFKIAATLIITAVTLYIGYVRTVFNAIKAIWDKIADVLSGPISSAKGVISGVLDTIGGLFSSAKSKISNVWDDIKEVILGPIRAAKNAVSGILSGIGDAISGALSGIKGTLNKLISAFNRLPGPDIGLLSAVGVGPIGPALPGRSLRVPMMTSRDLSALLREMAPAPAVNLVRVNVAGREVRAVISDEASYYREISSRDQLVERLVGVS